MRIPGMSRLAVKWTIVFFIPVLIYILFSQSLLHRQLRTSVTNDPEAGLTRSLSALRLTLDRQWEKLSSTASRIAQDELLGQALLIPVNPSRYSPPRIPQAFSSSRIPRVRFFTIPADSPPRSPKPTRHRPTKA